MSQAIAIEAQQEPLESDLTRDRYEIVDGELRELPPMGAYQTVLASKLVVMIDNFASERKLGVAVAEVLFVLDAEAKLQRRPDVAFVAYGHWPDRTVPMDNAWNVVPDLAVEIISRTNSAAEIETKIGEYFEAGVRLVWVIYPVSGRVHVYPSIHAADILESSQELDGGDVLPGFKLPIARLYEAVTKPE